MPYLPDSISMLNETEAVAGKGWLEIKLKNNTNKDFPNDRTHTVEVSHDEYQNFDIALGFTFGIAFISAGVLLSASFASAGICDPNLDLEG